jgi:hypothetical protein
MLGGTSALPGQGAMSGTSWRSGRSWPARATRSRHVATRPRTSRDRGARGALGWERKAMGKCGCGRAGVRASRSPSAHTPRGRSRQWRVWRGCGGCPQMSSQVRRKVRLARPLPAPPASRHKNVAALRTCLVAPTSGRIGYTAGHEHDLSEHPFRRRVGLSPTALADEVTMQPTATSRSALGLRRPLLSGAYRLPLALSSLQLSAMADRVLAFHAILPHWSVDLPLPGFAGE